MLKPTGSKQVMWAKELVFFNWLHVYSVLLPSSGQNIYSIHFYIVFQVIEANCMTSVVNNAQNFSRHRLLLMKWTPWGKRSTFTSRVFTEVCDNEVTDILSLGERLQLPFCHVPKSKSSLFIICAQQTGILCERALRVKKGEVEKDKWYK